MSFNTFWREGFLYKVKSLLTIAEFVFNKKFQQFALKAIFLYECMKTQSSFFNCLFCAATLFFPWLIPWSRPCSKLWVKVSFDFFLTIIQYKNLQLYEGFNYFKAKSCVYNTTSYFHTYIIESRLIWKNCLLNNMWTTNTGYRITSKSKKLMFLFTGMEIALFKIDFSSLHNELHFFQDFTPTIYCYLFIKKHFHGYMWRPAIFIMVPSWGSSLGYEYTMTQYMDVNVEYLERLHTRCNPGLYKNNIVT